ncbi:MAG: PEPxxWA-CTERM sorting domain-containing protein, partial [Sandaracinobacteroides sp.]
SEATYTTGFLAGGTADMARDKLMAGFDSGNSYVNLHTTANPRGEIRGQISAIPEASTWVMLISGFGLVGAAMRRRTATARPALQN